MEVSSPLASFGCGVWVWITVADDKILFVLAMRVVDKTLRPCIIRSDMHVGRADASACWQHNCIVSSGTRQRQTKNSCQHVEGKTDSHCSPTRRIGNLRRCATDYVKASPTVELQNTPAGSNIYKQNALAVANQKCVSSAAGPLCSFRHVLPKQVGHRSIPNRVMHASPRVSGARRVPFYVGRRALQLARRFILFRD